MMASSRRSFGSLSVAIALMFSLFSCPPSLSRELPCEESTPECLEVLHSLATLGSPALRELDIALAELEQRIKTAKQNNQKAIFSDIFSPLVAALVQTDNLVQRQRNPQPVTLFTNPWATIAAAIGVPLFQQLLGGNPAHQSRAIAISDLETRVEQLKRSRRELEERVKDNVTNGILELERLTLEQQQAIRRLFSERQRQTIREIQFRNGQGSTPEYLAQLERLENLTFQAQLATKNRTLSLQRLTRQVYGYPPPNAAPPNAATGAEINRQ